LKEIQFRTWQIHWVTNVVSQRDTWFLLFIASHYLWYFRVVCLCRST